MTGIVVKLQVEGIHWWSGADSIPEMSYLKYPHRHVFHITAKKAVNHDDRDIEIVVFKRQVETYLKGKFWKRDYNCCFFQGMSCEMIAKELAEYFGLFYCEVLEDGENGAVVEYS